MIHQLNQLDQHLRAFHGPKVLIFSGYRLRWKILIKLIPDRLSGATASNPCGCVVYLTIMFEII